MSTSGVALLSVYDKTGIESFAEGLVSLGWKIYASGGTMQAIQAAGISVQDVAELVGGKAILGHRVVTLSREISAGLLADKNSEQDLSELAALNLPVIDLVCVDMYPLESTISKDGSTKEEVIAQTDIGGPTMLRSAAKGQRIVVSRADQREAVLAWLKDGKPNEAEFIEQLAARGEYEAARYILASARYRNGTQVSGFLAYQSAPTKYGENPQQAEAALYADNRLDLDPLAVDKFEHIKGMERSFINLTDLDRLLQTVTHIAAGFEQNFKKVPSIAVGVKHGNACGAGVADSMAEAVKKMLEGDTRAIFGGMVMMNGPIDETVATILMHHAMEGDTSRLLDGVVGSSVSDEALQILSRNKLRVIINPALENLSLNSIDTNRRLRPVRGGVLEQPNYNFILDLSADYITHSQEASEAQKEDMVLGWAIGCTSNSNTIAITKDSKLIGNGVGQQDRVGAGQLALTRTTTALPDLRTEDDAIVLTIKLDKEKLSGATAYSDSFFPFPDGPGLLADAGIRTILTSSGSVADQTVTESLVAKEVTVYMLPDKVGRGFYLH